MTIGIQVYHGPKKTPLNVGGDPDPMTKILCQLNVFSFLTKILCQLNVLFFSHSGIVSIREEDSENKRESFLLS